MNLEGDGSKNHLLQFVRVHQYRSQSIETRFNQFYIVCIVEKTGGKTQYFTYTDNLYRYNRNPVEGG